ncbi:hypothetical protein LWI29_011934 [Acer saccharum]|uniref:Uncharacterized protein n=1 Tax=Acer saccharum TaxID=4024 RepID=A0AA39RHV2_ACESA|nr:hypothetical protein LWI29_011934 [Acer saccharum]
MNNGACLLLITVLLFTPGRYTARELADNGKSKGGVDGTPVVYPSPQTPPNQSGTVPVVYPSPQTPQNPGTAPVVYPNPQTPPHRGTAPVVVANPQTPPGH